MPWSLARSSSAIATMGGKRQLRSGLRKSLPCCTQSTCGGGDGASVPAAPKIMSLAERGKTAYVPNWKRTTPVSVVSVAPMMALP